MTDLRAFGGICIEYLSYILMDGRGRKGVTCGALRRLRSQHNPDIFAQQVQSIYTQYYVNNFSP